MFFSFKDRDTPLSTTFSQLLIQVQVKSCKLIMLRCITIVNVVFLSSPCWISVVFPMFLRSLHLFVYGFNHVIQVPSVASIHLRGRHEHEKWKIRLCSTCRVLKCLCFIQCKCKWWIPCLLRMEVTICIYVATHLLMVVCYLEAPKNKRSSGTWLGHPSSSAAPIEAEFFLKNRKYISTLPGSSE